MTAMNSEEELRGLIDKLAGSISPPEGLEELLLRKTDQISGDEAILYEPMLYFVLQGAKQLSVGGKTIIYKAPSFLILAVEVPVDARVLEASSEKPFLGIEMRLRREDAGNFLFELPSGLPPASGPSFGVGELTSDMTDALLRLARLLENPADARSFAPLYTRELLYRIAQGSQGSLLRDALGGGGRFDQLRRAVQWIRSNYREKLRIETLAEIAGMSVTAFYRHFKSATTVSPGAYHKRIRLHEARRLLAHASTVSSVAFAVGYESVTQFSREYARQFGLPPGRDAARIRSTPALDRR